MNKLIIKEGKCYSDDMKTRFSYYIRYKRVHLNVNSWVTHYYELAFPIQFPYWASKADIKELPLWVCACVCFCMNVCCAIIYSTLPGYDELEWPVTSIRIAASVLSPWVSLPAKSLGWCHGWYRIIAWTYSTVLHEKQNSFFRIWHYIQFCAVNSNWVLLKAIRIYKQAVLSPDVQSA